MGVDTSSNPYTCCAKSGRCRWTEVVIGSISGHNLESLGDGYTMDSCKAACEENPDCKSVDFKTSSGKCILGDCQVGDGECENDEDGNYKYSSCVDVSPSA